ncbi:MAG: DNA-protecting protein DprA, partial [Actinomycetota bacterium]
MSAPAGGGSSTPAQRVLLQALGHEPVDLDALAARTGWAGAERAARLRGL